MAELLSMTRLSSEPAPAAKSQATLSNGVSTEQEQSFAATLAAEVNGKAPDRSAKNPANPRQNTASDAAELKKSAENKHQVGTEPPSDATSITVTLPTESDEEKVRLPVDTEEEPQSEETAEAGQSHWFQLLEKAKGLHDRLVKAEKAKADTRLDPEARVDKPGPGLGSEQDKLLTATAVTEADIVATSAQTKDEQGAQGALKLTGVTLDEQNAEQLSSTMKQTIVPKSLTTGAQGEASAAPAKSLLGVNKETAADQQKVTELLEKLSGKTQQESAINQSATSAEAKETADISLSKTFKESAHYQSQTSASNDKTLKGVRVAENVDRDTAPIETSPLVAANKTQLQVEQSTLAKVLTGTLNQTEQPLDAEPDTERADTERESIAAVFATEPKTITQTQSAAAVAVQPSKTSDSKLTTEEALKQIQAASTPEDSEQGSAASSDGSEQQNKAESLRSGIEQQKGNSLAVTEASSFSNQLKSSLEKTQSALPVTGREPIAEQNQKQIDVLGQKLSLLQPEASNQLKEKMLMMVKDKVHTAEIRLDPSELGSMQIKINLQQDQMSVQFMVQQGNAKELMEQQMPKLKELLQQQGIELSQGSVQQQNQSSSGQGGGRSAAGGGGAANGVADELIAPAPVATTNSDRVVDYYA